MTNFSKDIDETVNFLGKETIDCLECLFVETNGEPPYVNKKRYRVNHIPQMTILDHLENPLQLIKTEYIDSIEFYRVCPHAIPLINTKRSKDLLEIMSEFFEILKRVYKERLDEILTKEELLKLSNISSEKALEALFYFKNTHDIWTGWGNGFPYDENSHIQISEKILLKENIFEILTDYYRWNLLKEKEPELKPTPNKNETRGRPTVKQALNDIYDEMYVEKQFNYESKLKDYFPEIQKRFKQKHIYLNDGVVQRTAMYEHLGDRFKEDKHKKSVNP
jgi:hypothetical protein